jgi:hypothetical protein
VKGAEVKKVKNSDLKAKDARIASLTISDQIHLLDRVSVAQHLPSDVLLLNDLTAQK